LKEKLTATPILGMPRDEGTYYLHTDVSDSGLGAALKLKTDKKFCSAMHPDFFQEQTETMM